MGGSEHSLQYSHVFGIGYCAEWGCFRVSSIEGWGFEEGEVHWRVDGPLSIGMALQNPLLQFDPLHIG